MAKSVCYFLVADIARLLKAEIGSAMLDGSAITMTAKGINAEICISADDSAVMVPDTIDRDLFIVINGIAQCNGYSVIEYSGGE